jgi:hypothetical protein
MIRGVLAATLVSLPALPCAEDSGSVPDPRDDPLVEQIRLHDARKEMRRVGLLGLRLTYPQKFSGTLGFLWARQPADFDCTTGCDFRGPMVQIEPGIAGAQVSAGYAIVVGDKGRNTFFVRRIYVGWGIKVAFLRNWGNEALQPATQSFLGIETEFTITQVNLRFGVFRSTSRAEVERPWMITGGVGWGF